MGCGCGMTCWRRLRDWQAAGIWHQLHQVLLTSCTTPTRSTGRGRRSTASFVRAFGGGEGTGPSPVDRAKPGSKHHVMTDGQGIPLASSTTAANVNDVTQLRRLFKAIPPVRGKRVGRAAARTACMATGAMTRNRSGAGCDGAGSSRSARRGTEHGSGLGVYRWVVERTLSWLHAKRKLRVRTDRRIDIHQAFLSLACSLICLIFL